MDKEDTPKNEKVEFSITLTGEAIMYKNPSECMRTIQEFYEHSLKTIFETCLNDNGLVPDDDRGNYLKDFKLTLHPPQVHQSR